MPEAFSKPGPTPRSVAVVGGGLAGLTAAAVLARAGRPVVLFESSSSMGGRAKTRELGEYRFNLGPRALYAGGAARRILDDIGVRYHGRKPPLGGGFGVLNSRRVPLPMGLWSLLTCSWMSLGERFELAGLLARLPRLNPKDLAGQPASNWLEGALSGPNGQSLVRALIGLTTYCSDLETLDAESAVAQLQLGLGASVLYLDGGWQTLVQGLRHQAVEAGAEIRTGEKVETVSFDGEGKRALVTVNGQSRSYGAAILAVGPTVASRLLGPAFPQVVEASKAAHPVRAACLDVGLRRLPRPDRLFALGLDQPLYLSVHSASARLAPEAGALVHAMKYLKAGETIGRDQARRELEGLLDLMQPGWRQEVEHRQLMPNLLVSHDTPSPGRAPMSFQVAPSIFLAGDWVGSGTMLADAAVSAGQRAAEAVLGSAASRLAA